MMNESNNDAVVIGRLLDVLDRCEEKDYEDVLKVVKSKFQRLKKPLNPQLEFLRLRLPNLGRDLIESEEELDSLRLAIIKKGVDANIPEADYHFACHLYEQRQFESAVKLYKRSADKGYAPSQHCYGLDRYHGIANLEANKVEGLKYLELAAGRLYELSIEFLVALYQSDDSKLGRERFKLYSKMLSWTEAYNA